MRFCFNLAGLAASALLASAASLEQTPPAVKTIVRADASGRLVRSVVIPPRVVRQNVIAARPVEPGIPAPQAVAAPANTFREAVDRIAEKHQLPPQLVHSVIGVESNYNPYAVSPKGAQGLMQLIPSTARRFGVANVFNPVENVEGGARYLRYLLDLYHNNYMLALAAYNAGEGAVARHGGVPPYPETVNYLKSVANRLARTNPQAKKTPAKAEAPKPAPPPDHNPIHEITEPDGRVHYVSSK